MKYQDYYKTLELERKATPDEIQKAYRRLARKYHPDVNKQKGAEERFKEINEANEVLSDPAKRKRYDALGSAWHSGQDFKPPPGFDAEAFAAQFGFSKHGTRAGRSSAASSMRFEFGNQGGAASGFSDFFKNIFGGGSFHAAGFNTDDDQSYSEHEEQQTRADLEIEVTLGDLISGAKKQISIQSSNGVQKSYAVKIPAGAQDGSVIRLAGQAKALKGHEGDLLIRLKLVRDESFMIDGQNIIKTLPITPWEVMLGEKIAVDLPDGRVMLNIPGCSQNGARLRVKGRGIPTKSGSRGDALIELKVVMPNSLDAKELRLVEELSKSSRYKVR
jgi:curved DNA-binding protein